MAGRSVREVASDTGTPVYLYDLAVVRARIAALRRALASTGAPGRIYYAMKANRFGPLLAAVRGEGDVGIDACSPREVALARSAGFRPDEISVTGPMLSSRDLDALATEGVHVNLDSFSAIRRYAERVPRSTRIGLRLDSGVRVGYMGDGRLTYGRGKMGLAAENLPRAAAAASAAGLVVDTLHVHCGWGLQAEDLPAVSEVFATMAELARTLPTVEVLNVGGGLGVRRRDSDRPLALEAWAAAIAHHLVPLGRCVACEPGTFIADDAGILVVEVNTVEEKGGVSWVGVDAGHPVNMLPALYDLPVEVIHVGRPGAPPEGRYSIAGNIGESNDVFATDCPLPRVHEGDLLAFYPAGAYGATMASDHCLRGCPAEVAL